MSNEAMAFPSISSNLSLSAKTAMPSDDRGRAALDPYSDDVPDDRPNELCPVRFGGAAALAAEGLPSGAVPVLEQAGALPWRIGRCGSLRILLVTSRRRGRWIVPKGWPWNGRSPRVSAEREAFEEAGVIGTTSPAPLGDFRYLKTRTDGSQVLCDVALFGLKVRGTLLQWREKGQRKRKWCSLPEAAALIDEPDLKRLLAELSPADITGSARMPAE